MTRAILLLLLSGASPVGAGEDPPPPIPPMEAHVPIRAITAGPMAHWFAYYDKYQFDPSDRYALGMQVGFEHRAPGPDDTTVLGMIDLEDGDKWIPFAESTAWCWQQGCMLQWLPGSDSEVIYNAREGGGYISVIQNVFTGAKRTLPRPIYAVSPDGKTAVGLNFARVARTRPGYGYNGLPDPFEDQLHPEGDGIYSLDLTTGESRLIVTLDQIAHFRRDDTMGKGQHWFNHLLFSPDGSRFIFLHRWQRERGGRFTRGFTVRPDGSGLFCFNDHGMVSHFIWRDAQRLLAWSTEPDWGNRFHLYEDMTDNVGVIGEGVLTQDGHCTYSPERQWILTDTYPDRDRMQTLVLFRPADGRLVPLGRFYQARPEDNEWRCDLHPRWTRNGRFVCIDSKWSGQRQIYLLDVGEIVASGE